MTNENLNGDINTLENHNDTAVTQDNEITQQESNNDSNDNLQQNEQHQDVSEQKLEKSYTKEEVDRAARMARIDGAERAKREMLLEMQRRADSNPQRNAQENPGSSNLEILENYLSQRDAKIRMQAEAERYQAEADAIAFEVQKKVDDGKNKYPDLEQRLIGLNLNNKVTAKAIALANEYNNTADVLYELTSNPKARRDVEWEIYSGRIGEAKSILNKLSKDISQSSSYKPQPKTLDHLSQSRTGGNTGEMTSDDYFKKWF